jgi:cytokinin dehydrogenase
MVLPRSGKPWRPEDLRALAAAMGAEGDVHEGPEATAQAAEDFGRLVRGSATVVAMPKTAGAVEAIIRLAGERQLPVTVRGRGFSQGGQSVPAGGLLLDLSSLKGVEAPDLATRTVRCAGGATWREVIARTAPQGLLPCVAPLNLDLTVGGTLSIGGFGATSHFYGPAIANVANLAVVAGEGVRRECSPEQDPLLWQAVLGGLGRVGVIVSATLQLRGFKSKVRTFYLLYDDLAGCLEDHRRLVCSGLPVYLESFCTANLQGLRNGPRGRAPFAVWFYALHVSYEYDEVPPQAEEALAGLHPFRLVHIEDNDTVPYAARYEPRFEAMRRTGAWQWPHPWVEATLPGAAVAELLPQLLDVLPLALGENPRLFFVNGRPPGRFFMMPEAEEVIGLAFTPVGIPSWIREEALTAFRTIHTRILAAGGKRYGSGWLEMDEAAWRAHFGERFNDWLAAKQLFDPHNIFTSQMFVA